MRFLSYFNTAIKLIGQYKGAQPLAHFLRQYFALNKKHGSKDRKYISHFCYCYFRLGHALKNIPVEERLKAALFLCNDNVVEYLDLFTSQMRSNHSKNIGERIAFITSIYNFDVLDIFPWQDELSEGIDATAFAHSHLVQPDLFLRVRPGKQVAVVEKLSNASVDFEKVNPDCIALANTTKIDNLFRLNDEVVVQDYSSQRIREFLNTIKEQSSNQNRTLSVWDCCAASGGKSILAFDVLKNIELTVSDVRPSIINNLQSRFREAGISKYKSLIADLTIDNVPNEKEYDIIICDAPCSGSGTWSRTPEQLCFFGADKIGNYSMLQQKIVRTIIPKIKENGYLLYITCSVFKKENEYIVKLLLQHYKLTLVKNELLTGYDKKADSMFAALFTL